MRGVGWRYIKPDAQRDDQTERRPEMEDRIQDVIIPRLITELRKEGIAGLPEYERRLRNNAGNTEVFKDLLLEADAALMFSRHGFKVTIQEKPDLRIELDGEVAYAEVKHFLEKDQDQIDEQDMRDGEDLVPTGILTPTEGSEAWEQLAGVAIRKINRYKEGAPIILVIATDSNSVDGSILPTAVHLYNEQAFSDPCLRKLNAFMLIDQWVELRANRNVYFCQTAYATTPISSKLIDALASIQRWSTPRNITSIGYR
jgi:hypothetical protein